MTVLLGVQPSSGNDTWMDCSKYKWLFIWEWTTCITPTCVAPHVSQPSDPEWDYTPAGCQSISHMYAWIADSLLMMQLWRYGWEVKNLQQCAWLLTTFTLSYLPGQHTVKLRLRRITCAADNKRNMQECGNLQAHTLSGGNTLRLSPAFRT